MEPRRSQALAGELGLHRLRSALAIRERAEFFRYLKDAGVPKLSDRQKLTNALMSDARAGLLPSPALHELESLLKMSPSTVVIPADATCRIFAIADIRSDYPFNRTGMLKAALAVHSIEPSDVCVCCGATFSNVLTLREALTTLRGAFEHVVYCPTQSDLLIGSSADRLIWEERRPQSCRPHPAAPRDSRQQLHALLQICDELNIHYGPLHIRRQGPTAGGVSAASAALAEECSHDGGGATASSNAGACPRVASIFPLHALQIDSSPSSLDAASDRLPGWLCAASLPEPSSACSCEMPGEGSAAKSGEADDSVCAGQEGITITCSAWLPASALDSDQSGAQGGESQRVGSNAVCEWVAQVRPLMHICAGAHSDEARGAGKRALRVNGVNCIIPAVGTPSEWQLRNEAPRLALVLELASGAAAAGSWEHPLQQFAADTMACTIPAPLLAVAPPPRYRLCTPVGLGIGELVFGTYGDDKYEWQRERICGQAVESGWFTRVLEPFTRADAERLVAGHADAEEVLTRRRGGGYWIWKPLVVREMLRGLRDGDIILYADAGCSIVQSAADDWWDKVRHLSDAQCIDAHQLDRSNVARIGCPLTNGVWSRMDTVLHVLRGSAGDANATLEDAGTQPVAGNGNSNKVGSVSYGSSPPVGKRADDASLATFFAQMQIEAGRLLILNCSTSRALIDEWCDIALHHPRLFTDEKSAVRNHPGFKEHRHDQSVFSALMWRFGLEPRPSAWESVPATQLRTESRQWWDQQGVQ